MPPFVVIAIAAVVVDSESTLLRSENWTARRAVAVELLNADEGVAGAHNADGT